MKEETISEVVANGLVKAIDYIESNLISNGDSNILSINNISLNSNISPSYLQAYFKKFHGIYLHTYIIRRKMTLAAYDLIHSSDTIEKIAEKYGYEINSFIRGFKKIHSITPTECRKNGKIEKEFLPIHIEFNIIETIEDFDNIFLLEKNCMRCVFCMGNVCAGRSEDYGEPIEKVRMKFPNGCEEFKYTLNDFIENEELKEELLNKLIKKE